MTPASERGVTWPGSARAIPRKETHGILVLVPLIAALIFGPAHTPGSIHHGRQREGHDHPRAGLRAHGTQRPLTRLTGLTARARKPSEVCSNSDPRPCIVQAAERYGQSVDDAEDVAWCESRDEADADNEGRDLGLFQEEIGTFDSTRYRRHSIWEAQWNALAAMELWSRGHKDLWECQ